MAFQQLLRAGAGALLIGASACSPPSAPPVTTAHPFAAAAAAPRAESIAAIAAAAVPVTGAESDYAHLLRAIGDADRILLGESTHGTHEYYRERARLSEQLIRERGINAIAIEADWTPTYRVNQYVRGLGTDRSAGEALRGYTRFPAWMWGNTDFRDFVERLRAYNMTQPPERRVGLYGMDVYDLFDAADAAVAYSRRVDPAAAERARRAYRCFDTYDRDTQAYGAAARRASASCQDEAAAALSAVQATPRPAGAAAAEERFAAIRSAASVAAAEEYFRAAYAGSMSWNVRDHRMAENVEAIAQHLSSLSGQPGKVVMWSHNTHSGDARATFAAQRGELNLGQLMRQRHGEDAFLIGYFSYVGTVRAAPDWGMADRVFDMRPAMPGSYAALFHGLGVTDFSLLLRGNAAVSRALAGPMLERAIGVVYRPETERMSHYFEAQLSQQFDAVVYFDRTRALTPLR